VATASEPRNWGDPWIGLRYTAVDCLALLDATVLNPMPSLYPGQTPFGSPDIWEDIANFFSNILYWVNPANSLPWLWNSVVYPAITWLKDNIWNPIMTWMWDRIAEIERWFGTLWNSIVDGIAGAYDSVKSWLRDIANWMQLFLGPPIEVIKATLGNVYSWLYNTAASLWTAVVDIWASIQLWLQTTFSAMITGIGDLVASSIERVKTALGAVADKIWSSMQQFWWWLGARLNSLWTWLGTIMGKVTSGIGNAISLVRIWAERTAGDIVTWWNEKFWPWLSNVFTSIVNLPRTIWQWLVKSLKAVWETVAGFVIEVADKAIALLKPVVERWAGAFQNLPATFLNWVAMTAGTNLALEPHRALSTTGSLYMMSMVAGTGAHVLATALNAIPGTDWVGAAQLSAYIAQAAGFEELTRATYGVLINEALTQPLRYYWNAQLRPHQPTEGAIFAMGRKRGLTRGEFGEAMAKEGLPEWWIDKEYQFFWADPSPYWLLRMSEHSTPEMQPSSMYLRWLQDWLPNWRADPWAWFKMKLMLAGFEDTDIPAFIEGFQTRRLASAVTQVKTSVRAMLREGYWDQTDAAQALTPLRVRPEEITYMVLAEDLDYQNRYLDAQVQLSLESFRKGELSRQDLSMTLSLMIVKPERVAQLVSREEVRALPKPKSVVLPKEDPIVKSLVRQAVSSWTKAYRDWTIVIEDLRLGLTIVLQNIALAEQLVTVERTRYRPPLAPPPPVEEAPIVKSLVRQAVSSWTKAYRDWLITLEDLRHGLTIVFRDPVLAEEAVIVERTRYRPEPPYPPPPEEDPIAAASRRYAIASWIRRFREGRIDAEALELGLTELIDNEELVLQVREIEELRAVPAVEIVLPPEEDPIAAASRRSAIASWVKRFREGTVSAAELELGLISLIPDPTLVEQIRQIEELRARPAPDIIPPWEEDPSVAAIRQETVRGHLEMFRKRLINVGELYTYLVTDGLVAALARSTAITQALKRIKTPPLESPYFQKDRLREVIDTAVEAYTRMLDEGEISPIEYELSGQRVGVDEDLTIYIADTQALRRFCEPRIAA